MVVDELGNFRKSKLAFYILVFMPLLNLNYEIAKSNQLGTFVCRNSLEYVLFYLFKYTTN